MHAYFSEECAPDLSGCGVVAGCMSSMARGGGGGGMAWTKVRGRIGSNQPLALPGNPV